MENWKKATCLPDDCFCEALRDSLILQPANTWSSFAFVVVAIWIVFRIRSTGAARAALAAAEAWLLVGVLVVVGLGSAFYHASFTFAGQVLDVSGMYLLATFILLHRLAPRFHLPPLAVVFVYVALNAGLLLVQVVAPSLRRGAFVVLIVTALTVEWRSSQRGRRWLLAGALLLALAAVIWALDWWRLVCSPHSLLQGHALWHLLGALASFCLFKRYEEEAAPFA